MARVKFTAALKRFFPNLEEQNIEADTVKDVLEELEDRYPGIKDYIVEEDGILRKHVNIFLDSDLIQDKEGLSDQIAGVKEVLIFQALSGG